MPLRVMTFNIRNSGAGDGPNSWEFRRELWVGIVWQFEPDLLGVQEVLADQYDQIEQRFPDYTLSGVAREDGRRLGEWSLILYKTTRFDKLAAGDFWLSQSPALAGSRSWGSACSRMCSWVRLRDRDTGRELLFANVHLDHVSDLARRESANLMMSQFQTIAAGCPVILTGDFNCTEVDGPYARFIQGGLIDSYRALHPTQETDESSFHNFGRPTAGLRIDWVLHSPAFTAIQAKIDRTRGPAGQCASDHDAVTAVLEWAVLE